MTRPRISSCSGLVSRPRLTARPSEPSRMARPRRSAAGVGLDRDDPQPGPGEHLGDPRAHGAQADDGHLANLHGGDLTGDYSSQVRRPVRQRHRRTRSAGTTRACSSRTARPARPRRRRRAAAARRRRHPGRPGRRRRAGGRPRRRSARRRPRTADPRRRPMASTTASGTPCSRAIRACAHHSNSAFQRAPTVMMATSVSRRSIEVPNRTSPPSELSSAPRPARARRR